jgi:pyruvate kinase
VARTTTTSTRRAEALRLHDSVAGLRDDVRAEAAGLLGRWRPLIERDEFVASAANLADYIALRHHDLRNLQLELMPFGLSSLGRCEARVMPSLDAVIAALAALAGESDDERPGAPDADVFFEGHALLNRQSEAALGPTPPGRAVRIMVTLPTEAATDFELVRDLSAAGMDTARINCGHDDSAAWAEMVALVRQAASETGRPCRVCFDLSGPRSRVEATTIPEDARLVRGDRVLMIPGEPPAQSEWADQFQCSIREIFDSLRNGAPVWINDGKLGLTVERRLAEGILLRVTQARAKGEHLRRDRALNFPETELRIEPLTEKDLSDLDAIVPLADIVGYSFVQRPGDIVSLEAELARRGASPSMALIAKVETAAAIQNLPELIVQGAGARPLAIMIARGDLMVEVGHRRMAEMQEELLWLCEAAHVPVIWATQVLDNFVKKGVRNRAELTDAAMAERAECVMLNKGSYVRDAVGLLADVLGRMEGHQFKKASRMRALHSW